VKVRRDFVIVARSALPQGEIMSRIVGPVLLATVAIVFSCGGIDDAQSQTAPTQVVAKATVAKSYRSLLRHARVNAALASIKTDDARTFEEQKTLAQIAAAPFKEAARAQEYLRRMHELGLADAAIDAEGNVVALRKGAGRGPTLVLSAHLDTVFPEGTDLTVQERGGRFYGPGLGDDSRGLAVVLAVLRAMQVTGIKTSGDVLFVGTVGEEGAGDLRGVKALFRQRQDIDGFISVEPPLEAGGIRLVSKATGSHRWTVLFQGPGGHSYLAFGAPSAVHAMGRAIAHIADVQPPADPKTTFTVGVVSGGTSVNAIAAEARMEVDIRSDSTQALEAIEQKILACVDQGVAAENARWHSQAIHWEKRLTGDRPAGATPVEASIVQAALQSAAALKMGTPVLSASSTDSNVPIALGVPAVTMSGGGLAGGFHSLDEWFEPAEAWRGAQHVLLTTLALVGVENVSEPLLQEHNGVRDAQPRAHE
jgi:acetylornithine deacetylase/succinyl-diaminopimelate desuccinylase-like protein